MKQKKKILGVPAVLFIVGILVIGGVSAALVNYFGKITQTITVEQAVTLSGTGCSDNECIYTETIQGGETSVSKIYKISSMTSVDGEVTLNTICSADNPDSCVETITTPIFVLSIPSETAPNLVQDRVVAKANALVGDITSLNFEYMLTETSVGNSPYFVLAFDTDDDDAVDTWAVSLQDTATADTWNTHGNGLLYHNVGACTQSSPCDLAGLKTQLVGADLLQVKVMIGYWGDTTATTAQVKNIEINGVDVTDNGLIIRHYDDGDPDDSESGDAIVDFFIETYFPFGSIPKDYTITTEVQV